MNDWIGGCRKHQYWGEPCAKCFAEHKQMLTDVFEQLTHVESGLVAGDEIGAFTHLEIAMNIIGDPRNL